MDGDSPIKKSTFFKKSTFAIQAIYPKEMCLCTPEIMYKNAYHNINHHRQRQKPIQISIDSVLIALLLKHQQTI